MSEEEQKLVKDIVSYLCSFFGEKPKINFNFAEELGDTAEVSLKVKNPEKLIGDEGNTMIALQHLVRVFFSRHSARRVRLSLDINNYRRDRRDYLKELAVSTAQKVSQEKRLVVLKPMNAFERRIIHLSLAERNEVKTESLGEATERRVIVKPTI